jgi:hypothetical protein
MLFDWRHSGGNLPPQWHTFSPLLTSKRRDVALMVKPLLPVETIMLDADSQAGDPGFQDRPLFSVKQ